MTGHQWLGIMAAALCQTVRVQWVMKVMRVCWTHMRCTTALLASLSPLFPYRQHQPLSHCDGSDQSPCCGLIELLVGDTVASLNSCRKNNIRLINHVFKRQLRIQPLDVVVIISVPGVGNSVWSVVSNMVTGCYRGTHVCRYISQHFVNKVQMHSESYSKISDQLHKYLWSKINFAVSK